MKKLSISLVLALTFALLSVGIAGAITNGQKDTGNTFSNVAIVFVPIPGTPYGWLCSGTAISETEVLTAAHCFLDGETFLEDAIVIFDHNGGPGAWDYNTFYDGKGYPHPEFGLSGGGLPGFDTHDIAIVEHVGKWVGTGPFPGPYSSLPDEGDVDDLPMRQDLIVVGYGIQGMWRGGGFPFDGSHDIFDWNRYYAPVQLIASNHVHSDEYIKLTANPAKGKGGTCFGDSGGPVFIEDGGDLTVIAVTSYGTNQNCAGLGYYNRIDLDYALDWIGGEYKP